MKLNLKETKDAITGISKIITRSTPELYRRIKVDASGGVVTFTGTNSEGTFATYTFEDGVGTEMEPFTIQFDSFAALVKKAPKVKHLTLTRFGNRVVLSFDGFPHLGQVEFLAFGPEDFPTTPHFEGQLVELTNDMRNEFQQAYSCTSNDTTRYVLNGVFLGAEKGLLSIVGTDGRRLFCSSKITSEFQGAAIIPKHKFLEWSRFNTAGWSILAGERQVNISCNGWSFITDLVDGKFPNYKQVIPDMKDVKTTIKLDMAKTDQLLEIIKMLPQSGDTGHRMTIEWDACLDHLSFSAPQPDTDHVVKCTVPFASASGESITIHLDREYFTNAIKCGFDTINLIAPESPMIFTCEGADKQMVIMPMRV